MKTNGISLESQLSAAFDASENTNEDSALGVKPSKANEKKNYNNENQSPQNYTRNNVNNNTTKYEKESFTKPQIELATEFNKVSIDDIVKIIDIYKIYSQMDERVQKTTCSYLKIDIDSSPAVVVQTILSTTKSDVLGLTDLVSLRKDDGVSRVFNLLSLSDDRIEKLNDLVPLFIKDYNQIYTLSVDKISYCRILEHGLSNIQDKALNVLSPISVLLSQVNK